ncbi:MAG: hypothetical protein R2780_00560 [Crocinitomicaceae bacterium]|nr:hypothetical protein [Crocinitomicaceae bacterium]
MENKILKYISILTLLCSFNVSAQQEWDINSEAERPISPSYRITENPKIIDTIIPIPDIKYPLLVRNMETQISLNQIDASKIKIKDKLDKLYPGYVKVGLGMYTSPLAEVYFNSTRNRRLNYGIHVKHNSSWKNLEDLAPSTYDNTTAKLFGQFFTTNYKLEGELDYLNNGYHWYGITDTTDFFSKDSLKNRVQGMGGMFRFGNFDKEDSAKLVWSAKIGDYYFHEFKPSWDPGDKHARNNNFIIGSDFKYRMGRNLYALDFNWIYNRYWYAEDVMLTPDATQQFNERNANINLRPVITTFGDKWKVMYGLDMTFDFPKIDKIFKVVPVVEAKYSLLNDMFIPYVGIDGGVTQNSFYTLNRMNPYIFSGQELRNQTLYNFFGGIKGTLSKTISFNVAAHYRDYTNKAIFVNEAINSDLYKFDVNYVNMSALGAHGSITYQNKEKLKIDVMAEYNIYKIDSAQSYDPLLFAYHMPTLKGTIRGSYNLFDKLYAKADLTLEYGRKSPVYLYNQGPDDTPVDMPLIADGNLHLEYRYNPRISAFLQFNNIANQKYDRWYRYRVQGFQILGGVTFGF